MKTNSNSPEERPENQASDDLLMPPEKGAKISNLEMVILEELGFGSIDAYFDEDGRPRDHVGGSRKK
jgi:hypothetical protein